MPNTEENQMPAAVQAQYTNKMGNVEKISLNAHGTVTCALSEHGYTNQKSFIYQNDFIA